MATTRVPATVQPSGSVAKHALRFSRGKKHREKRYTLPDGTLPLKAQLRALLAREAKNESEQELQLAARRWFANKAANTQKPPQGIGRTRTRVKKGGGGKAPDKDLSGR